MKIKIPYKIGVLGLGNISQALLQGWFQSKTLEPNQVIGSNRSPGKLQKAVDTWNIHGVATNEELVDAADVVVLAAKPQDLSALLDPLASAFRPKQIVLSLAAGSPLASIQKKLQDCRIARVLPNLPCSLQMGVTGYFLEEDDLGVDALVTDLFQPLGEVVRTENEDQLEGLLVSSVSGTGFALEIFLYFQEWLEERGVDGAIARRLILQTFAGAAEFARRLPDQSLEDIQAKVTSKKGVTAAGLDSMRELELERLLRYSFEKAALRNQELAKLS